MTVPTAQAAPRSVVARSVVARGLLWLINAYRYTSPVRSPRCRYLPTCSAYAIEAIETHGAGRGTWLSLRRLGRCHPLGSHGYDPVPEPDDSKRVTPTNPERDPES